MKRKVVLYRYDDGSNYQIYYGKTNQPLFNSQALCPKLTKKWLGLKRHLVGMEKVGGYLEVKFTPTKKRKKAKQ